jgi:PEP-CTERM motif
MLSAGLLGTSPNAASGLNGEKPMRSALRALAACLFAVAGSVSAAHANSIQYFPQFTYLQDGEDIAQYYNGGSAADDSFYCGALGYCYNQADASGSFISPEPGNSGAGPNWGITFSSGAAVTSNIPVGASAALGASGTFSNSPSGSTKALVFVSATNAVMDVSGGFNTGFAFYYSAEDGNPVGTVVGSVAVWSGLDGTGTMLGLVNIMDTTTDTDPTYDFALYDVWAIGSLAFDGTAESVVFSGLENNVLFQVVSIGTTTPNLDPPDEPAPVATPEPESLALLGAGIACLGMIVRRRRIA